MPKLGSVLSAFLSSALLFAACSSAELRPAASVNAEGGTLEGGASGADASDAHVIPETCRNTTKDEKESDVDCGGKDCEPCALGKSCTVREDCAGGAECVNKVCALCKDNVANGDETDVDCGGKACGPCTVGKRCKAAADCRSSACTNDACACPKDMTIIALAGGGAYCIDQAEVSKGQYNKFITANVPVTDQAGACLTANDTFIPRGAWPPATAPGPLEFNLGLPVHYVDWCDAFAYCKWAKKQLCGTINGATVPPNEGADATKSAWFNACSAQGTKTFPYGGTYDPVRCNGNGTGTEGAGGARNLGFGYAANEDDHIYDVAVSDQTGTISSAAHIACQGGSVGVYQMSGNVAEWEDSCDGSAAASNCRVRGGSYDAADDPSNLSCGAVRNVRRMPAAATPDPLKDVGLRCCVY